MPSVKKEEPKKNLHGGAGRGQGRKAKFKEATTIVSSRCPVSKADELKAIIAAQLEDWLKQGL